MLFPWQCQVVSLHYSWPCSPAPVQGLSPCSNAIFITHTHIQTVAVREGLMVMLSPWTNKHLITLWSHLNFNWITFPLQGKVSGRKYTNTEHDINTQVPTNLYTENSRETLPLNILWQHLSHLTPHTHTHTLPHYTRPNEEVGLWAKSFQAVFPLSYFWVFMTSKSRDILNIGISGTSLWRRAHRSC